MCTGLEIASLVALMGGTGAQVISNEQKADAMEDAAKAEAIRQAGFDEKKAANFKDALAGAEAPQQQERLMGAEADIADALQVDAAQPASYRSPASSAPRVVQDYADSATADELSFVNALAKPRAKMGAWREGMTDFATMLADKGWSTDELNRRLGRSAQIGQMEAQEAYQNTGNELALAGNLATTLGGMGLGSALFARGAAGVAPTGAAGASQGVSAPAMAKFAKLPYNPYLPVY